MPYLRRRPRLKRDAFIQLDADHRQELETGTSFFGGFEGDTEAFALAWRIHGPQVLAEFIEAHPGRRPFAWWVLVHKQERPLTDPDPPAQLVSALRAENLFGFLHSDCWGGPDRCHLQQPEVDYLAARGLFTKAEQVKLFGKANGRARR
jgi:hypothetical protein